MKTRKNFMHARRPVELILTGAIVLLVAVGAWSWWAGRSADTSANTNDSAEVPVAAGTRREIDATTEEELVDTALVEDDTAELQDSSQYESAADNFGGIYDESAY